MDFITIASAGHIDHGKTSLIKSLTNIDTDTLKQEKDRGLTIDLGFAHLKLIDKIINFVDVPGHKDFIKNMLAGISGVNTVLLVISANEGIMPQTLEHIDIIKLLGIKNIVIIISKIDLVNLEQIEILKKDISELLEINNLKALDFLLFSTKINKTINSILEFLNNNIHNKDKNILEQNFILPIDRCFTKKGLGTIVTGTIYSGIINLNDNLYIHEQKAKVKNIQLNNENIDSGCKNQRISLNINIDKIFLKRGDILSNKVLKNYKELFVTLESIDKIKNNDKIKFYYLTKEITGRINLLNKKSIEKDIITCAKIVLDEEIVITHNMKFIIRLQSPEKTLGGGRVLSFNNPKKKVNIEKQLFILDLLNKYNFEILFEYLISNIYDVFTLEDLEYYFDSSVLRKLIDDSDIIVSIDKKSFIHKEKFLNYKKIVIDFIKEFNEKNNEILGIDKFTISNELRIKINLLDKILESCLNNEINSYNNLFFIKKTNHSFSLEESKVLNSLTDLSFQTIKDLSITLNKNESQVKNIINSLKFKEQIVIISEQIICKKEIWQLFIIDLKKFIGENKKTTSEIREFTKLSRKYIIPILEYLDKLKITKRDGDFRYLLEKINL
ncbi:MAG: selenocysteine-specific translation elongation factor [Candidatus Sericytochromatia bacterium]